jgi:heptosyltransferase-2
MNEKRPKILLIRFSSLGDLVILTALIEALADAFPGLELHLATKEIYSELFEGNPSLYRLHTLKEGSGFGGLLRLRKELASDSFDIMIDAHNVIRSNFLYRTLDAGRKVQLSKDQMTKLSMIRGSVSASEVETVTLRERYLSLLGGLGAEESGAMPRIITPHEAEKTAEGFVARWGLAGAPLVALAPGARWETKRWPERNFSEVARRLAEEGTGVVLVGDEPEKGLCSRISSETGAVDACGILSIMETAALLRMADLLVTNDSAPLHIAEACGTPVVGIYGPTVRQFGYFPLLPESIALESDVDCRPCSRNGSRECRLESRQCLESISPDLVLESVSRILGRDRAGK